MFLRLSCRIPPWLCTSTGPCTANPTRCGHAMWLDTTLVIDGRLTGRHSRRLRPRWLHQVYTRRDGLEGRRFCTRLYLRIRDRQPRLTMAMQQNNRPLGIILTLKILQFVRQLRRRVKPRVLDGSITGDGLGIVFTPKVRTLSRRLTLIGVRGAKESQRHSQRIRRQRKGRESWRSAHKLQTLDSAAPANRNLAGDKVQQYVLSSFLFGFTY